MQRDFLLLNLDLPTMLAGVIIKTHHALRNILHGVGEIAWAILYTRRVVFDRQTRSSLWCGVYEDLEKATCIPSKVRVKKSM